MDMKMTVNLFFVSVLALGMCAAAEGDGRPPNILFIMSDDHARNAISAYGSRLAEVAPTPNIDRIGTEGVRLEKCFVTNSIAHRVGRSFSRGNTRTSMGCEHLWTLFLVRILELLTLLKSFSVPATKPH